MSAAELILRLDLEKNLIPGQTPVFHFAKTFTLYLKNNR